MEWKPKIRRVPTEFVDAVEAGFDYDHSQNIDENRQRAADEGYEQFSYKNDNDLYADWLTSGRELGKDHAKTQWDIGDWLNFGFELRDINHKDRHRIYGMASEVTGLHPQTLKVYAHVARCVNSNIRDPECSFAQHQLVASLPQDKQNQALAGMHCKTVAMSKTWLNLPATRALLKLDENDEQPVNPDDPERDTPKPKSTNSQSSGKTRTIIRLCDQLSKSLSKYDIVDAPPDVLSAVNRVLDIVLPRIPLVSTLEP
jgi:hypothetical protein